MDVFWEGEQWLPVDLCFPGYEDETLLTVCLRGQQKN